MARDSPTAFSGHSQESLVKSVPLEESTIIQYVGYVLVASETEEQYKAGTLALLQFLTSLRHRASLDKF